LKYEEEEILEKLRAGQRRGSSPIPKPDVKFSVPSFPGGKVRGSFRHGSLAGRQS
jgi:hypothetical protein